MKDDIRNKIKQLCDSEIVFDSNWVRALWEGITDICQANEWQIDEVIDALPEKIRTVFLLSNLRSTIWRNGFFSVFYNESPYEIKRLRRAFDLPGLEYIGGLFDEALQLVESQFKWSNEHINFVGQTGGNVFPPAFFDDEVKDRIEEIEKQIADTLFTDDWEKFTDEFEKTLEAYVKS